MDKNNRLAEIAKRAEKATPGPWEADGSTIWHLGGEPICCGNGRAVYSSSGEPIALECCGNPDWQREQLAESNETDAAYIAAANPAALLDLIARVKAAEDVMDAARAEMDGMRERADWFRSTMGAGREKALHLAAELDHWQRRVRAALVTSALPAAPSAAAPGVGSVGHGLWAEVHCDGSKWARIVMDRDDWHKLNLLANAGAALSASAAPPEAGQGEAEVERVAKFMANRFFDNLNWWDLASEPRKSKFRIHAANAIAALSATPAPGMASVPITADRLAKIETLLRDCDAINDGTVEPVGSLVNVCRELLAALAADGRQP